MKPQLRYYPGDRINGRYQVHKALLGGMGEVYLCLDLEVEIPLALKTFQQRFLGNARLRQAFEEEVAIWVRLEKHSNIVRCHYMDFIDQQPFMFLEWIGSDERQGAALRSWLQPRPIDLQWAITFIIDICNGLMHADKKQPGLVHRDLKPENILIAPGRIAKITDFGLAKIVARAGLATFGEGGAGIEQPSAAQARDIAGTPAYMAPEQWRVEALDARTDIYALGCILYEMAAQRPLYVGNSREMLQAQHVAGPIPVLTDGDLPLSSLNTVLARCLAKRREDRFAGVAELREALSQLYAQLFGQPPRVLPESRELTAAEYVNRGNTFVNLERHQDALADYDQAIRLQPTLAEAYYDRGIVYERMTHYEAAREAFTQAIKLDPNLARAYLNRANVLVRLQRYDEALADFAQAIQLDPEDGDAFYNRGVAYEEMQRWVEAVADYSQAIQLEHTHAQAYLNRGVIFGKAQRFAQALDDLTQAIRLDPANPKAYSNRGNTYASLHRHAEAVADLTKAVELSPSYATAYFNRAVSYSALQQFDEALVDLQRVIELNPDDAEACMMMGALLIRRGALREALVHFEQAAQLGHPQAARFADSVRASMG